jgi:hypothetical protein
MILPQAQGLRIICMGTFAVFLGWLVLHLILEGHDVDPIDLITWASVSSRNAADCFICAVLVAFSLAVALYADSDQSNVAHAAALYSSISAFFGWIILSLDNVVEDLKGQVVDPTDPAFYQDVVTTSGAFMVCCPL